MDILHFYSPSQIDTFRGCARKWAFKSLLRLETPQNKSAALGDEVHRQLENYLRGGEIDYTKESGYIAAALLPILPDPREKKEGDLLLEERKIDFEFQGFLITGKVDWTWRPNGGELTVGDHKTTSNIFYAKTTETLKTDPQALIYAYEAMARYETPNVRLVWDYVQTRKPYKAMPVELRVESPFVVDGMKAIVQQDLIPMRNLLKHKVQKGQPKVVARDDERVTALLSEVPPTPDHCQAFGGCPYQLMCPDVSAGERLKSSMTQSNAANSTTAAKGSFFARLKNKAADNPPPAEPEATPDPVNPPEAAPPTAETKALVETLTAPAAAPEPEAAPSEEKKRKGRPPGSTNKPKAVKEGITLYVDCAPVGSDAEANTIRLIAEAKRVVNEQLEVADYRFKGFGEGQGALAVAAQALAKTGDYGQEFVVQTNTAEGGIIVVPLREIAASVVMGFR